MKRQPPGEYGGVAGIVRGVWHERIGHVIREAVVGHRTASKPLLTDREPRIRARASGEFRTIDVWGLLRDGSGSGLPRMAFEPVVAPEILGRCQPDVGFEERMHTERVGHGVPARE